MQLLQSTPADGAVPPATAVTIGMFDGVHCGHQMLIRRTVAVAAERGLVPVALTFDRHPDEVLRPEKARPYLTTLPEKVAIIRSFGISLVAVARVSPSFLAIPAREFVHRYLRERLHAQALIVGHDFHFGRARQGNVEMLGQMAHELGFTLEVMDALMADGTPVSSTLIRRLLAAGDVAQSAALLGRPYRLSGEVAHGEEIGRTLGFPTANVSYPPQKILPALGVYLCRAIAGGTSYGAVVNVGRRPTFDGTKITVEAYLLGFSGDLYGQTLALDFLKQIRAERKFPDPQALREQIAADVREAGEAYATLGG